MHGVELQVGLAASVLQHINVLAANLCIIFCADGWLFDLICPLASSLSALALSILLASAAFDLEIVVVSRCTVIGF